MADERSRLTIHSAIAALLRIVPAAAPKPQGFRSVWSDMPSHFRFFSKRGKRGRIKAHLSARRADTQPIRDFTPLAMKIEPHGVTYYPIPKCGSSSVKFMLLKLQGRESEVSIPENEVHHLKGFGSDVIDPFQPIGDQHPRRFTIIRDPLERLLSAYCDRVPVMSGKPARLVASGLEPNPDPETFFSNVAGYCAVSSDLRYHLASVRFRTGGTLWAFERVFRLEQLGELHAFLEETSGKRLEMLQLRENKQKLRPEDLSENALRSAMRFCRHDYAFLADYYSADCWGGIPEGNPEDYSSMVVYADKKTMLAGKGFSRTFGNFWNFLNKRPMK